MDFLVLSPCSSDKRFDQVDDVEPFGCAAIDETPRQELVRAHSERVTSAADMYTGQEHRIIRDAVEELRTIAKVDWKIISAGFGLLDETTEIPYYDCSFSPENIDSVRDRARRAGHNVDELTINETIKAVAREKRISEDFQEVLRNGYDVVLLVLGKPYLLSVADALTAIPTRTTAYAFAPEGNKGFIGDCQWVPATKEERTALSTTWSKLRGKMLATFATNVDTHNLQELRSNPNLISELSS